MKSVFISILSSVMATSAFANPFVKHFKHHQQNQHVQQSLKTSQSGYVDFSGTWVGSCDDDDEQDTITLKNDESSLTIDGSTIDFNRLSTDMVSDVDGFSEGDHTVYSWNDNHTALIFSTVGFEFYRSAGSEDPSFYPVFSQGEMMLDHDKLIIQVNHQELPKNGSTPLIESSICTYTRK